MTERFPQEIYLAIAARIKDRRKYLSITQVELAKSINLDRTAISRIENGGRHLEDAVYLFLIAEKLDIPLNHFFPDELKNFVDRKPKYPNTFNILPQAIKKQVDFSGEKIGNISSSQLYALIEIFKENPWGKLRRVVASIFPLLRNSWASSLIVDEMEKILLPIPDEKPLRFHTRLLAANIISEFILSLDNLISPRGKTIKQNIEEKLQQSINNCDYLDFELFFWLRALSNIGVKYESALKITEVYPGVKKQIQSQIKVNHLILAYTWGELQKKDGLVSSSSSFEQYLNFIIFKTSVSTFDICLNIWAIALKSKYYEYRTEWLKGIFLEESFKILQIDQKIIILINALCTVIHDFNSTKEQKKEQVYQIYNYLIQLYKESNLTMVKVWMLQLFLFLMQQEMNQVDYAIGLKTEIVCNYLIENLMDILKTINNPIEKTTIVYCILSSRIEKYIKKIIITIFDERHKFKNDQNKFFQSLIIDIFCRINIENLLTGDDLKNNDQEYIDFCTDPFTYLCKNYEFPPNLNQNHLEFPEDNWVVSAILRKESSILAHSYFLPQNNTIYCTSLSYNYVIGDAIKGTGIRFNLLDNNDWWIWKILDDDGDVYTLYASQIEDLTMCLFVNEYFPLDSGFVFFKEQNFSDGFYVYHPEEEQFWGGAWAISNC